MLPIFRQLAQFCRAWLGPTIALVAVAGIYRLAGNPAPQPVRRLDECHAPAEVAPLARIDQVASDAQLLRVLQRMVPGHEKPNTNAWLHALRLWGPGARFESSGAGSGGAGDTPAALARTVSNDTPFDGAALRDFFLSDVAFRRWAGSDAPALVSWHNGRLEVRPYDADSPWGATGSVHPDDVLATLAEIGVTLDQPLEIAGRGATVRQLLADALARYHRQQLEYEWTTIAWVRYGWGVSHWQNEYGQRLSASDLVDELIEQPLRQGVCGGTHRLEALVLVVRLDSQHPVLSHRSARTARAHLAQCVRRLVEGQHAEGWWTKAWPKGKVPENTPAAPLADRILATGHHLEWMALLPTQMQPPRESVIRAGQWLVRAMLEVDEKTLALEYGPFSHAARALCLWRGLEPADVLRDAMNDETDSEATAIEPGASAIERAAALAVGDNP